ncbi:hypothetical protein ACFE04_000588 [Oxalis oulophora]
MIFQIIRSRIVARNASSSSSSWMKIIADRRLSSSSTNIINSQPTSLIDDGYGYSQSPRIIDFFNPPPVPIHESDMVSDETLWALYQRWISSMDDYISRSSDEQLKCFPFFKKKAILIYNGNKMGRSYTMGLNRFADETDDEKVFYDLLFSKHA